MNCWNRKDGWVNDTKTKWVSNGPTSESYIFNLVYFVKDFARHIADQYWGVR